MKKPFHISLVPIKTIKGAEYNPRSFDKKRFALIKESLKNLGWLIPAYVCDGVLLSGHQRTKAWQDLGYKEIPVVEVEGLSLETMRGLNILFNLATNDFRRADLGSQIESTSPKITVKNIDPYPCMNFKIRGVEGMMMKYGISYAAADGWQYTKSMLTKGVVIPLVVSADGKLANGSKRLFALAKAGVEDVPVVFSDLPANYIEHFLNKISMDFDLKKTYSTQMRYGSFRRLRLKRESLGHGFSAWIRMQEYQKTEHFNHTLPENIEKIRRRFGNTIVDFGAGHLHETRMLQSVGLNVIPFEPYHVTNQDKPDLAASRKLTEQFLKAVASKITIDSIIISSVFNSVPFKEDRDKILRICAVLSDRVFICTRADRDPQFLNATGRTHFSEGNFGHVNMLANFENNTILGEIISGAPKAQKFYTLSELKDQVFKFYHHVSGFDTGSNVYVHGSVPKVPDKKLLRVAIDFEFNLPYPNNETLGMAVEAIKAFKKRGTL
ncbi:MAG: ParB N-terminal domain-containing protein [Bacteroidota bacterium]